MLYGQGCSKVATWARTPFANPHETRLDLNMTMPLIQNLKCRHQYNHSIQTHILCRNYAPGISISHAPHKKDLHIYKDQKRKRSIKKHTADATPIIHNATFVSTSSQPDRKERKYRADHHLQNIAECLLSSDRRRNMPRHGASLHGARAPNAGQGRQITIHLEDLAEKGVV